MGLLTQYGLLAGLVPVTTGRVFWVSPSASYTVAGETYSASDYNDGLTPFSAFRTVDYAIGKTTANVGDVVVLLPGAHSVSATVTLDIVGVTVTGIPATQGVGGSARASRGPSKNKTSITTTETAGMIFTVTATDVEIAWLHFIPITAGAGVSVSSAAHRFFSHDNTFALGSTAQTATFGITFPVGVTAPNLNSVIRNCYFLADGAVGPAIRAAQSVHGLKIESSTFELTGIAAWAKAIQTTLANVGVHIRDCDFVQPTLTTTVITAAIDVTGMTADSSCQVYRCYFPEGCDGIVSTATGDVALAESYTANSTGGTLKTSA